MPSALNRNWRKKKKKERKKKKKKQTPNKLGEKNIRDYKTRRKKVNKISTSFSEMLSLCLIKHHATKA